MLSLVVMAAAAVEEGAWVGVCGRGATTLRDRMVMLRHRHVQCTEATLAA